jgi:pimeloyl-ACP methyl ester carboxylesterase
MPKVYRSAGVPRRRPGRAPAAWLDDGVVVDASRLPVTYEVAIGGRVLSYCLYGPPDGSPVIAHGGSPGTRWRRPEVVESIARSGVRLLAFDRPGYPGSTRQPGRRVADVVPDVEALARAQDWERFAVFGYSGGAPYALACAALLPDRVTRCAVGAGVAPPQADDDGFPGGRSPGRGEGFRLAVRGESALRPRMEQIAHDIMAAVEAGGPEMIPEPPGPDQQPPVASPPALDDPAAMARLRATFVESHDGWVDDLLAVARPWGLDPATVTVPVGIWHGKHDTRVSPAHTEWLVNVIPTAHPHIHDGGHAPTAQVHQEMLTWLKN